MKRNSNKFEKMNPSSIQIILSATLPAILPKKLSLKRRKSGNYQNPTAFVLINRQQVAGRRPISFFQALGSRGSAKQKEGEREKQRVFLLVVSLAHPFFARLQLRRAWNWLTAKMCWNNKAANLLYRELVRLPTTRKPPHQARFVDKYMLPHVKTYCIKCDITWWRKTLQMMIVCLFIMSVVITHEMNHPS